MTLLLIGIAIGIFIGAYGYDCLTRKYQKQIRESLDELMALLGVEKMPRKQSEQMNEILAKLDAKKKRKRK